VLVHDRVRPDSHASGSTSVRGLPLLTSGGELAYCVDDRPRRRPIELERILRTEYRIDRYQDTCFVFESFDRLMRETAPDFTPHYVPVRNLAPYPPDG
jgi:phenylalanine-4-hydroxylase